MFFSKGINFLLGKRSAEFDVNSLPDIDSVKEVKEFVSNVQETLKDWRDLDELKVIVEFLVDVSEKYDIIAEFSEIWIGSLYNSFNTELLQQMLDITMNAVEKNPNFFNNSSFFEFFWQVLEKSTIAMQKFTVLRILQGLLFDSLLPAFLNSEPNRVNSLLDALKEPSEFLRNECILLMRKIAVSNIDICKLLAFQGIFEVLCEIMRSEDGVVIEDCAELMKTLLTDFNKNYIRELPCVIQVSSELISSPYKDHIINFIFAACTTENDTVHIQNQSYFSKIIPQLFINAYPNSEQQHLLSLKLLKLLLRSNSQGISFLLQADQNDLLDNIVTHCVLSKSFEENIEILFTLLVGTRQLSENFISKVTCAPGYVTIPHVLPIFNHVVNQIILEKSEKIKNLCRIFEILLFANESSKQLAVHLPIDMVSGTLLNKIFNVLMECIGENSKNTEAVSSLLVVWLFESPETVMKLVPSVYNSLLQVINYLENKQGVGQCFVSLVIGLICLYAKLKDIDKLLIKKIGYSELCLKLELLYTIPEFNRILTSQSKVLTHEKCSYPLIKIYKNAVQAVKMHFLKEITESAPEDQKDLAKLIEAQEAVISMHYLKKNNQNDHETSQLLKKIADLEGTVQEKLIEIENLKKNTFLLEYEQHKEARSTVQTLILISGKLDLVEFENLSLQRENKNLNAKVERLHEEIKTYSVKKHEVHTELQLVEVKEKLKIQGNEVEYLKKIIEKKENELIEALEVIGKQEVQLQAISVDLIEIPNEELKLQEIPVDLKEIFNEKKSEICKKETANKSCGTEKQLEVKTELEICKCEMVNVWEKDQKDFWTKETQTTEEAKIVFEEPLQTENWFTEVKDNSDAISFFDNISYKPSTTSFF